MGVGFEGLLWIFKRDGRDFGGLEGIGCGLEDLREE